MSHAHGPTDAPGHNGAAQVPGVPIPPPDEPDLAVIGGAQDDRIQPPADAEPHDILAAEEFAFPAGRPRAAGEVDPRSGVHDVLAAEEFAFPAASHPRGPRDPQRRPHDVLAAEEFAFPASAARDPQDTPSGPVRASRPALLATGVAGLVALALGARRQRRSA